MAEKRITPEELSELIEEWTVRFEENLADAAFSAAELAELAERHRALAQVAESPGQRRAALAIADRYENAVRERTTVRG